MRTKEENREYMRRRRAVTRGVTSSNVTENVTENVTDVTPEDVTPVDVTTHDVTLPPEWAAVRKYISKPGNLARMRAVCGTCKHPDDLRFGAYGPTAREIGAVIGTGPAVVTPPAPPTRLIPSMISVHDLLTRAAHGGRG